MGIKTRPFNYMDRPILLKSIWMLISAMMVIKCTPSTPSHKPLDDKTETDLSGETVVWQGFQHHWSYNHRLARLGDFVSVTSDSDTTTLTRHFHTAATGLGEDVGEYTSYYTFARMQNIEVIQDKISFSLSGERGETAVDTQSVRIPLKSKITSSARMTAFINGFDLYSTQSAFKIVSLQMEIVNIVADSTSQNVMITLRSALSMNCRSIECKKFDTRYNYKIDINVAGLVARDANMAVNMHRFTEQYQWNKSQELRVPIRTYFIIGKINPTFDHAFLAFRRLSVRLDQEHWFIDWNTYLSPLQYSANIGSYQFKLGLMIREWKKGMRFKSVQPAESIFAMRGSGSANLSTDIELIQFKSGCSVQDSISGEIEWLRKEKHNAQKAINARQVLWDKDCYKATHDLTDE